MVICRGLGAGQYVERKTGLAFPITLGNKVLVATGLKTVKIMGVRTITLYAFGIYTNPASVKTALGGKFGGLSVAELRKDSNLFRYLEDSDAEISVRVVIAFDKVQIEKVRSGLEEDMKMSLKKLTKNDESKLLQTYGLPRFVGAFSNDLKIRKGSEMITTRLPKQTLKSYFEGKEIGSVQSVLLSKAWVELYFGSYPVDKVAKETAAQYFAQILAE